MADYTSFNDSGLPPMFQALQAGRNMDRNNQMRQAVLEQQFVENQRKQAELERYQGQTPGEVSKSQLEGAQATTNLQTPGYMPAIAAGNMGVAQQHSATGQVATATIPSDIAAKNAENTGKVNEQKVKNYERFIDFAQSHVPVLEAAAKESPVNGQMRYQQFLDKLDPQVRSMLPPTYGPDVPQRLKSITERATNNLAHIRKLDEERVKGEEQRKLELERGKWHLQQEKLRIDKKSKDWDQTLKEAKLDRIPSIADAILSDQDSPPALKARAVAMKQQAIQQLAVNAAKGQVNIPGVSDPNKIADDIQRRLGGGNSITNPQANDPFGLRK